MLNRLQHIVPWNFSPHESEEVPLIFNATAGLAGLSEGLKSLIISNPDEPGASPVGIRVFDSDRSALQLSLISQAKRHATQKDRLNQRPGSRLSKLGDWREIAAAIYQPYELSGSAGLTLVGLNLPPVSWGSAPEQPIEPSTTDPKTIPSQSSSAPLPRLCLFNVVVACEWWPISPYYQRQFSWAFRRMSDFLFDVTDGYMALGTVAIGGPEWMDAADIQILSSNRLHPRSWVSGMQLEQKYMPIRIGRGFWSKRKRRAIPWDEPEGYRTLVHEWGHYALGLKDHYLVTVGVDLVTKRKLVEVEPETGKFDTSLALPTISLPLETIMSTLEGTSELVDNTGGNGKDDEWAALRKRFPGLNIVPHNIPNEGPGGLPLPLPEIQFVDSLTDKPVAEYRFIPPIAATPQSTPAITASHCWVFTIRESLYNPAQLISHGILDAGAKDNGFTLLGAHVGDTLVLIGDGYGAGAPSTAQPRPIVLTSTLGEPDIDGICAVESWRDRTPQQFPIADVIPDGAFDLKRLYRVRVTLDANGWRGWIFPLEGVEEVKPDYALKWVNGGAPQVQSIAGEPSVAVEELASLDGHVLLAFGEGDAMKLTIAAYSIGGGPQSINPPYTNPIPAGSSEGNALIFFYDPQASIPAADDANVPLVITTRNYGAPLSDPAVEPRSYTFSFASNMPLPPDYSATLVMFVDRDTVQDDEALEFQRYFYESTPPVWSQIEALYKKDLSLAAVPLYGAPTRYTSPEKAPGSTAPGLFQADLKVERFRLVKR